MVIKEVYNFIGCAYTNRLYVCLSIDTRFYPTFILLTNCIQYNTVNIALIIQMEVKKAFIREDNYQAICRKA